MMTILVMISEGKDSPPCFLSCQAAPSFAMSIQGTSIAQVYSSHSLHCASLPPMFGSRRAAWLDNRQLLVG